MPTIMFWSLISCNLKCSNVSPCVRSDAVNDSTRAPPLCKYVYVYEYECVCCGSVGVTR
ncbi:LOW QUALITY PROTEIN: uncharacterized protein LOC111067284 [Drosophila obscura]|uniref:LOW QUALITY PROTEIN: uncharacterized protein LOC111067284 n=1 Tax=Drosophila obscura TaxID=7282 RepID=UPI001BB0E101|nr:LOW QUALITY PROTEIN: uncharacterized protein LOC111067284 [Drosophila obscura]